LRSAPRCFPAGRRPRSLAFLFTASALAGILAVILPADMPVTDATVLALAGLSVLLAIGLLRFGARISDTPWHVALATSRSCSACSCTSPTRRRSSR